jgi:hypothetical protein
MQHARQQVRPPAAMYVSSTAAANLELSRSVQKTKVVVQRDFVPRQLNLVVQKLHLMSCTTHKHYLQHQGQTKECSNKARTSGLPGANLV